MSIICRSRVKKIHENTLILGSDNLDFQETVFQESLQVSRGLLTETDFLIQMKPDANLSKDLS